ncbi:hypothetical protein SGGMMB4_00796 [Sodalis glossinidius str. 'morsitans']|uniref:Uncharacterized protein n=1 Tax=Sodalis glossinidius (strain morsitans) TaxID=343509 RepID=A0A193QFN5_SODGM|nr:DUF2635 domain-containing protein [Sodalis glossinidius]CRL43989.1 hypothetical protein SGGMMB4_00796 [Sodalis glossinidius str. 'morsitans']
MNDTDNTAMRFPNPFDLPMLFVVPAPERAVREPYSMQMLPDAGAWVQRNGFWLRRLRFKDVLDITPPAKPAPPGKSQPLPP